MVFGLGVVTSGESVFLYGTLKTVFLSPDAFAKGLMWFDKLRRALSKGLFGVLQDDLRSTVNIYRFCVKRSG
jgi:hypothetical protein